MVSRVVSGRGVVVHEAVGEEAGRLGVWHVHVFLVGCAVADGTVDGVDDMVFFNIRTRRNRGATGTRWRRVWKALLGDHP